MRRSDAVAGVSPGACVVVLADSFPGCRGSAARAAADVDVGLREGTAGILALEPPVAAVVGRTGIEGQGAGGSPEGSGEAEGGQQQADGIRFHDTSLRIAV